MTKKRAAVPRSKAKTAYDLLSHIAQIALAEPKRIRMAWWITRPEDVEAAKRPACGTIGCIGGWAIVLKGTDEQRQRARQASIWNSSEIDAKAILGLSDLQASELFNSNMRGGAGTLTHARAVVGRIHRFQRKYKTQLQRKAV